MLQHAVAHIELHLEAFSQLMVTIQESQTRSVVSIEPFHFSGFCSKTVDKYENRLCPKFSFNLCRGRKTRPDTRPSVADGWAGAEMLVFSLFDLIITDRRIDRWMDKASYRVACPRLKTPYSPSDITEIKSTSFRARTLSQMIHHQTN